MSGEQYFI